MTALIDIGNGRLKWATLDRGELGNPGQANVAANPALAVEKMFYAVGSPERMLISNVAGTQVASLVAEGCLQRWGFAVDYATTQAEAFGVTCGYADPGQLGVDRWLAVIAAHQLWAETVCVVDAGTALTVDVVNRSGRHYGGLILPGTGMMVDSLHQRTSNIGPTGGSVEVVAGLDLFGSRTEDAVNRAAILASAAMVDRAVQRVADGEGRRPRVVITGGDGEALMAWLESPCQFDAHLVLKGLALFASTR